MQTFLLTLLAAVVTVVAPLTFADGPDMGVSVARFDARDRLVLPADLDEWVFLGASLGMGYSQSDFDPDSPGMFQVARIEPQAWRAFLETGRFVDGTMIALHFYGSQNEISINRAGFVMDDLHFLEIHYKDSTRFPDGFNFYTFNPDDTHAKAAPLPNDCVTCHRRDGAYDAVFVQFYPPIQPHLPEEVRARLDRPGRSGHH